MQQVPLPFLPRHKAGTTAYLDAGSGEVLVLVHGVGLNAEVWKPQIAEFAKTNRVIAVDMLGHGLSSSVGADATLQTYVDAIAELLKDLHIERANIVGHSMGGLVALGFALAHPAKVLRLGVLNSVYRRSAEARAAVLARAAEITQRGGVGDSSSALVRWFGPRETWPPAAFDTESRLKAADPMGYASAYKVFAESDEAFVGRLAALSMPALFCTGSMDYNSSPEMAKAMAEECPFGTAVVIEGARHMMNLTHVPQINAALRQLLALTVSTMDTKDLRKAFGTFMTGVTVVTTCDNDGALRGFTANSFTSVSLDPPLLLVCLNKSSASCQAFSESNGFAVNILAESQKEVSGVFASRRPDKFENIDWTTSKKGNPIIAGSMAWFDCARQQVIDAGDHVMLLGRVESYAHGDANPLGYARGGYFSLGLEQIALSAAVHTGKVVVGAILEENGKLLAFSKTASEFELPHVASGGQGATSKALVDFLQKKGISAQLGFLFSVFEDPTTQTHYIFYRGEADTKSTSEFNLVEFTPDLYEKFGDPAIRIMLKRYAEERLQGRYKIYSGDHLSGEVRSIS